MTLTKELFAEHLKLICNHDMYVFFAIVLFRNKKYFYFMQNIIHNEYIIHSACGVFDLINYRV